MNIIYCIDTSSWIKMKDEYSDNVFPSLWKNITSLIKNNRIISPLEVKDEIEDDELIIWFKPFTNKLFIKIDKSQDVVTKEILKEFPKLVDSEKTKPDADPFVIALPVAKTREEEDTFLPSLGEQNKYIVVCEEAASGKGYTHKMPYVCQRYDIECIKIFELFKREQWKF